MYLKLWCWWFFVVFSFHWLKKKSFFFFSFICHSIVCRLLFTLCTFIYFEFYFTWQWIFHTETAFHASISFAHFYTLSFMFPGKYLTEVTKCFVSINFFISPCWDQYFMSIISIHHFFFCGITIIILLLWNGFIDLNVFPYRHRHFFQHFINIFNI